jgi:hypothetical protein
MKHFRESVLVVASALVAMVGMHALLSAPADAQVGGGVLRGQGGPGGLARFRDCEVEVHTRATPDRLQANGKSSYANGVRRLDSIITSVKGRVADVDENGMLITTEGQRTWIHVDHIAVVEERVR